MKKYWLFALVLLAFVFFFVKSSSNKQHSIDVVKSLEKIPKDDREALEWFFFFLNDSTGVYVLFGNKPMTFCSFQEIPSSSSSPRVCRIDNLVDSFFRSLNVRDLRIRKGWKAWKKYQHLFPSSNFILLENRDLTDNWVTIAIINKSTLLKKIDETIDVFKNVLGPKITSEKILQKCLMGNAIFGDVLKHHDGLLGILLGYGKHNAELFFRKIQIEGVRERECFTLSKTSLRPSEGFSTLEDEYNFICEKLFVFDDGEISDFNPLLLVLPGFMSDHNSPETQHLKRAYRNQYKKIISKYMQKDYLEVTLNQFCNAPA